MFNQKEAVFNAINGVLTDAGISAEPGQDFGTLITKELRAQVIAVICEGFRAGKISIQKEYDNAGLKAYTSGLVSNWLRKDKRLNGNVKYVAKNPGSRAGSGDESLKAMRTLLKTLTPGTEDHSEVQSHIDARLAELNVAKAPTIDYSKLPEALQEKFSK